MTITTKVDKRYIFTQTNIVKEKIMIDYEKMGKKIPFADAMQLCRACFRKIDNSPIEDCFPVCIAQSPDRRQGIVVTSPDEIPEDWDQVMCNAMFLAPPGSLLKVKRVDPEEYSSDDTEH